MSPHAVRRTHRHGLVWWMAVLFAIGSAGFALGAVPAFVRRVGDDADAVVFLVGSLFFTVAGWLQLRQAGAAEAWLSWRPADPDWLAAAIQSAGTLLFNVSTFRAMTEAFRHESTVPAWTPDAYGSIAFLISSAIAFAEARRAPGRWRDAGWDGWRTRRGRTAGPSWAACASSPARSCSRPPCRRRGATPSVTEPARFAR